VSAAVNPLTPGTFLQKLCFLDILAVFRLDFGQINFNLVENALATQQLAIFATSITFYNISGWISAKLTLIWSKMHLKHDSLPFFPLASRFVTFWLGHELKSRS